MFVEKASAVFIEGWRFSETRLPRSKVGKAAVSKETVGGGYLRNSILSGSANCGLRYTIPVDKVLGCLGLFISKWPT
jgi:hypothetical protein